LVVCNIAVHFIMVYSKNKQDCLSVPDLPLKNDSLQDPISQSDTQHQVAKLLSHDIFDLSSLFYKFFLDSVRNNWKGECGIPSEYVDVVKSLCWDDTTCEKIPCQMLIPDSQVVTIPESGKQCILRKDLYGLTPSSHVLFPASNLLHVSEPIFQSLKGVRGRGVGRTNYSTPLWMHSLDGESVVYFPWAGDPQYLARFNFSMGADPTLHQVHSHPYIRPFFAFARSPNLANKTADAPVMMMISNCNDRSGRREYIEELMKYIKIDSYGTCLHNKDDPGYIAAFRPGFYKYKNDLMSKYHFGIAFENSVAPGYITEKVWDVLSVGTIPLYFGAPDILDVLPDPNSIINVKDFNGPKDLADYLHKVLKNPELYNKHKLWYTRPLSASFKELQNLPVRSYPEVLCEATYKWPNLTDIRRVVS